MLSNVYGYHSGGSGQPINLTVNCGGGESGNYVTLDTEQTITGEKTFDSTINCSAIYASNSISGSSIQCSTIFASTNIQTVNTMGSGTLNVAGTASVGELIVTPGGTIVLDSATFELNGASLNVSNSVNSGSQNFYVKNAGGTSSKVLSISSSNVDINADTTISGSLTLDSSAYAVRGINAVFYNLVNTALELLGSIYGGGSSFFYDNNRNGGFHSFAVNNASGVQSSPLSMNSEYIQMNGGTSYLKVTSGSNAVSVGPAIPVEDSSNKIATTEWVNNVIANSVSSYVSPFITFQTNWINLPFVTPNMPGNSTSNQLSLNIPNQSRRYRISTVWGSLTFNGQLANSTTLQGIFRTNGQLQNITYFNMGCDMMQVTNNQDYQLSGGASSSGPIAGMAFMAGGMNSTQYTNQYSYEYVANFPANAVVTFEFTNQAATDFYILFQVSLYYD